MPAGDHPRLPRPHPSPPPPNPNSKTNSCSEKVTKMKIFHSYKTKDHYIGRINAIHRLLQTFYKYPCLPSVLYLLLLPSSIKEHHHLSVVVVLPVGFCLILTFILHLNANFSFYPECWLKKHFLKHNLCYTPSCSLLLLLLSPSAPAEHCWVT